MFIDIYESNRVSKYLEQFDKIVSEIDSIPQTNAYLSELESSFKEEKISFDKILSQKLKSFKAEFESYGGETIYADMYHPGIIKVIKKYNNPKSFYSAYRLKDIGYTICERVDEIKVAVKNRPSSIGAKLRERFEELLILIFIYGLKYVESSDDYVTWYKEKDTTFRQANDLKKLFSLFKEYKDIGCRLWVVKYFKRCNNRLLVLDDIEYDEVNYLELSDEEKKKERRKAESNNEKLSVAEEWLWPLARDIGKMENPTHQDIENRILKDFPNFDGVPGELDLKFTKGENNLNKSKIDIALRYLFNKNHDPNVGKGSIADRFAV
ncbi:hypothetical protein SAMN05443144_1281 [Fodinibius roseus]|uniref:Uncharacterized protein n=1 Tax=Fodinibius roseus TaxID=1194090 RepID=A0A1M5JPR2_9BACT|nr:hypothetical protein [Fodinibius roseus]SHG42280.1 hypothetical protein SAMN05443144_1281 [Fodinibius roseus]